MVEMELCGNSLSGYAVKLKDCLQCRRDVMDKIISAMTATLASVVCEQDFPVEQIDTLSKEDFRRLVKLSEAHSLSHILAFAFHNQKVSIDKQMYNHLKQHMIMAVYRSEQMDYELQRLCSALEAAKIMHIPLKGAVLRNYYPEPWMRTSCDIDILIKEEDLHTAINLLAEEYGYSTGTKGKHDISLFSPAGTHLELHFDLIECGRANASNTVLRTVWENCHPRKGFQYSLEMNDAMFYFYHIAHMAKHIEVGGCGVRPFLDLWLMEHNVTHNSVERDRLLKKGALLKFAKAAQKLSEIWFGGAVIDEVSYALQEFLITGGAYGSQTQQIAIQQHKQGGKIRYALSKIFIPYDELAVHFPIIKKHPILMPFMEVCRWIKLLFCGGVKRSVAELTVNANIPEEQVRRTAKLLDSIGL